VDEIGQGPWVDTRALPGLLDAAARRAPLRLVLADDEFDCEANHLYIRQRWRKVLFPHNRAAVFRKERCAGRCIALFRKKSTDNGRR